MIVKNLKKKNLNRLRVAGEDFAWLARVVDYFQINIDGDHVPEEIKKMYDTLFYNWKLCDIT